MIFALVGHFNDKKQDLNVCQVPFSFSVFDVIRISTLMGKPPHVFSCVKKHSSMTKVVG